MFPPSERKPDDFSVEIDAERSIEAEIPRPFDTSDLESIPGTNKDDPPYRDWWAVDLP